jgi:Rrf2 family protein
LIIKSPDSEVTGCDIPVDPLLPIDAVARASVAYDVIEARMKLSAKVEYASLAIIALARQLDGSPLRIEVICRNYGIPRSFLSHIILRLKAAGLVDSIRGPYGGYRLSRDAESISLGDVVRAVEEPDDPPHEVHGRVSQALNSLMEQIRSTERTVLDQTTMAQLAQRESPHE